LGAINRSGAVSLIVRDDGAGIPPEALPHIFERFYRTDQARRQEMGESGLGLAIARSIVEAHGGTITAESDMGKGTTFTITLKALALESPGALLLWYKITSFANMIIEKCSAARRPVSSSSTINA